jgi:hypothetical protein
MVLENNTDNLPEDNTGGEPAGSGPEPLAEGESYYDKVMSTKKYRDQEEMAKAIYHGDHHSKRLEDENSKLRDWALKAAPYLRLAEEYQTSDAYQKKYGNINPGQQDAGESKSPETKDTSKVSNDFAAAFQKDPEGVSSIVKNILGPDIKRINKKLTDSELKATIENMKADKKNFPFFDNELEAQMVQIFTQSGKSFPLSAEGLKILYDTAVGQNLKSILNDQESKVGKRIAASLLQKEGSFMENDREGAVGEKLDDSSNLFNRLKSSLSEPIRF